MRNSNNCTIINNESEFNEILKTTKSFIALFYATWCPYCIRFLPIFERNTQGKTGDFLQVVDDQEILADKYSMEVVPTVLFFENGAVAKRLDGVLGVGLNEKQLIDFINTCNLSER